MNKTEKSKPFGIVHREICEDERLSSSAVRLYSYLASFADTETGRCYPTAKMIEKDLPIAKDTLYSAKKLLEDTGYIVIEKHRVKGRFDKNIYILPLLKGKKKERRQPIPKKPYPENQDTVTASIDTPIPKKPYPVQPYPVEPDTENQDTNIPVLTDHILTYHNKHTNYSNSDYSNLEETSATGEKSDNDYKRQTEEEFERLREEKIKMLSRGK